MPRCMPSSSDAFEKQVSGIQRTRAFNRALGGLINTTNTHQTEKYHVSVSISRYGLEWEQVFPGVLSRTMVV